MECCRNSWSPSDFHFGQQLGEGAFGKVYKAYHKQSNTKVAIKMIEKHTMAGEEMMLRREIENQSKVKHKNVLRLYGCFQDSRHLCLVLEYAKHGTLRSVVSKGPLDNKTAAKYFKPLAEGLRYCHQLKIIHRDLKPDNVLFGEHGVIKVADFGLSVYSPRAAQHTVVGTRLYIAPEMMQNRTHGPAVDNWSMGLICFELLTGKHPIIIVGAGNYHMVGHLVQSQNISNKAKDLILGLLQVDPRRRMRLDGVLHHPWIQKYAH